MAITITIQAASDATMTENGEPSGTALADDDLRKVYGLPNQYVGSNNKIYFVDDPRWDEVNLPEPGAARQKYNNSDVLIGGEDEGFFMFEASFWGARTNDYKGIHRPPTTTAFQLQCNAITHDAQDMTTVAPMPGVNNAAGVRQDAGTPGQLNNLVIALGMRSEVIKLEGVLFDEGVISASNPRKQVLMNIARLQYFKTGRSGSKNRWGGPSGGPLNPRSYPCLTIFDDKLNRGFGDSYQITQPSGTNLSYRGLIKSFSFRQEGGRPNQWFWTLEFQVLQNEWPQGQQMMGKGVLEGMLRINRIRLINIISGAEISSFPTNAGDAVIEVRTSDELSIPEQMDDGTINQTIRKVVVDPQTIFITNSNSTPKIDGDWKMYDIDYAAKTFRLKNVSAIEASTSASAAIIDGFGYGQPVVGRAWSAFSNGTDGYVKVAGGGDVLQTELATISTLNEAQAVDAIHGYIN